VNLSGFRRGVLAAVCDGLLYCSFQVFFGRGVVAKLRDALREKNCDYDCEESEKRPTHLRPESIEEGAKLRGFSRNRFGGFLVAQLVRLSRLKDRLETKQPFSSQPRRGEHVDGVADDVKGPVWQLSPSATPWARLAIPRQGEATHVGPNSNFKKAGLKDQPAFRAERWEPYRQDADLDTFTLALNLTAIILGVVVGEVLLVWLF
jgi:hypothetical protein